MLPRATNHLRPSLALLLIAAVLLSAIPASASSTAAPAHKPAKVPGIVDTETFNLCASAGSLTMPDGTVVTIWGFSVDGDPGNPGGCAAAELPGPALAVDAGDTVTVNLENALAENVSIVFPGQGMVPDTVGAASGGTVSYSFTAADPGTYLYEAGTDTGPGNGEFRWQVPMGLYGALVVRPITSPPQAYGNVATTYDAEATLVLSEIDPELNNYPGGPSGFFDLASPEYPDTTPAYQPTYWLINGEGYPDTDEIAVAAGNRLLIRYLNAGLLHHTMQLLGLHQRVLAKDADLLPVPFDAVAETLPSGSTADMIVTIPTGASAGTRYALYNRQLHLTNGPLVFPGPVANPAHAPGGMLTFLEITGAPPANVPPTVDAGVDQTITLPALATLDGTVSDDGLLVPVTTTWTLQSGPGSVTFGDASAVDTNASFSVDGVYVLRLTANDGEFAPFDEVTITVNPAAPPPSNSALAFDGVDDLVVAGQVVGVGPLTVEAWVRATNASETGLLVVGADANTGWSLELNNGLLEFWVSTDTGWFVSQHTTPLLAGQWYHVAGTYASGQVQTFVNGVASSTVAGAGALTQGPALQFGGLATYPFFGGELDEVRISDVVRYTGNFTVPTAPFVLDANTIGLWSFDEGVGQTVSDESLNGNTGTLGSSAGIDLDDPTWVAGYGFPGP